MKVIVYTRQSMDRSGDALGVTRQRDDCEALAASRGWQVTRALVDNDTSAAGGRARPGFEELLAALSTGEAAGVVAWAWDRLERNRRDSLRLIEAAQAHGAHIALVRGSDIDMSTPAGRLSADVLASVARHEIEAKSDRQRRAVEQAVTQGRRVGGRRPFGYRLDMTPEPVEADAVRWAYAELLAGASLGAIARGWNARGLHTPQGRRDGTPAPWTPSVVSRTLRKACYAGLRSHRGVVVGPAVWAPLVDEGVWRAAQAVLSDPSRRSPGGPRALLTGVGLCGVCGATVHAGGGNTADRGYRVYRCRSMAHVNRRAEPVDEYVAAVVVARLSRPDAADLLTVDDRPAAAELHAEGDRIRARIDDLAREYADDGITIGQMRAATTELRARLDGVAAAMADAARVDVLGEMVTAADAGRVWDALHVDRRRAVIDTLMSVRLMSPGRGARTFNPASVLIAWRQP